MCEPLEARRAPKIALDAKFSLPYLVAVAVTRGEVGVMDFTEERLFDPSILALAQKVTQSRTPVSTGSSVSHRAALRSSWKTVAVT